MINIAEFTDLLVNNTNYNTSYYFTKKNNTNYSTIHTYN